MAQFQIDDTNANSAVLDLAFNLNPFGTNTWTTASGDATFLGVDNGNWSSSGLENRVFLRDSADAEVAFLAMNVAVSLTDPFGNLALGDSGDGLLLGGPGITRTLLSK